MDVVQVFNDELQSLLESKPPVSKAKMGLITRAAMKGVKFYKHIVQSVEKFIAKCRPEYKVPGLYVIDSIVRQSRHQFGIDRDVYAARFSRNLQITFNNLFSGCTVDDKPKVVRVLNLWQKNGVFNSQVIQPLLDMAHPNSSMTLPAEPTLFTDSPNNLDSSKQAQSSKYLHQFAPSNSHSHHSSANKQSRTSDSGLRFSKNMLDFDYDEDDDDEGDETPTEAEPPLSSTLNKIEMEQRSRNSIPTSVHQSSQQHYDHNRIHQPSIPNQLNQLQSEQDPVLERWNKLMKQQSITNDNVVESAPYTDAKVARHRSRSRSPHHTSSTRDRYAQNRESTQVRDQNGKQTGSTPSKTGSSMSREDQRKIERAKKCLPEIRDKHLTVCSSTLWLGHVPKTISEADISDAFGEFGSITSIDLIPPRGCAYVCMDRRQDAKRALSKSKDLKLNGSHIKMAWAPGKGFKEYKKLKEFWEVDIGTSYIPYSKIDDSIDFDVLEEGGLIDEDSMSMEMRQRRERKAREKEEEVNGLKPGLSLPLPALPILNQPPPFAIPPPNMTIPPPTALGQAPGLGVIPFPPPTVATGMSMPQSMGTSSLPDPSRSHPHDKDASEGARSPCTIDQQISITERQISMVEQQLSMIQQAQGMNQAQPSMAPINTIYHQNQPNPLIFDMPPPQLLHNTQMMDSLQAQVFGGSPALLGQAQQSQSPMLPINQAALSGNPMSHYGGNPGARY